LGVNGDPVLEEIFKKITSTYDFMSIVMYPTLNSRREFIHDCWLIAKATENDELKVAISKDPYFYLTREDLLALLRTEDNTMITHILKTNCNLNIREDISYKLISIKGAQVDKNQMTPVRLLDFISVMVLNKREDNNDMDSLVLFKH
jgi:glutathione synthase/RimK-type ligase-like ATP-grasp enzyme